MRGPRADTIEPQPLGGVHERVGLARADVPVEQHAIENGKAGVHDRLRRTRQPIHQTSQEILRRPSGRMTTTYGRSSVSRRESSSTQTRLGDRLLAELLAHDGIMIAGPLIGARTTKPTN
jgi:hypothetical protein